MEKTKKLIAKGVASVLNTTLHIDANSASCAIIYQPKAPDDLSKYRKIK